MNIPEAMKFIENDLKMALDIKRMVSGGDRHLNELDDFIDAHRLAYRALQKMRKEAEE